MSYFSLAFICLRTIEVASILVFMNPVRDKNLESSGSPSASVSNGMKRIGVALILILAFLGLADSAYLAQHEASGVPLLCNIQNLSGCNIVVASQYSHIFGIPLAQYGVIFYGVLFVLAALELVIFNRLLRRSLQVISLIGIIASLYFILIQAFFISAFCIYCLASAAIALLIFICASFIEPFGKKMQNNPPPIVQPHLKMPPMP